MRVVAGAIEGAEGHRVLVRTYEPGGERDEDRGVAWGTLVWAHGGSFVRGTLDWPEADWVSRRFAEAGLRVYSVDYALASETVKAPVPGDDVAAALREARRRHRGPVFVGGASAGGQLATYAALVEGERAAAAADPGGAPSNPAADALILLYPTLHRVQRADSEIAALTATLPEQRRFDAARIAAMYDDYLGDSGEVPVGELSAERLALLPSTIIVNAWADDLRASGEQFAEQLRTAGVPVRLSAQHGTVHGYLNRPEESPAAERDALATISGVVAELRQMVSAAATSGRHSVASSSAAETRHYTLGMHAMERQIPSATSLTTPDGHLNREAIGWATQPIIDTSGLARGRGRNKRWEYWNVTTPTHIIALTVSHIDYACVHEVWVFDRQTEASVHTAATVLPARGAVLASTLEQGRSMARAKNLAIDIDEVDGGTRLRAEIEGASFDIVAALPEGHERLALVVPWSDTRFQYTVKDVARPATGVVRVGGVEHQLPEGESWAVLDHGRGRWPYDISWNWGAGSGTSGGRTIGVQLGAKWTDGTGVSENAFFVDGRMHKIHGATDWQYDIADWKSPWRVTGGGFDATFTPFYNKITRTNLLVLRGYTDQCFGYWAGSFATADGERIEFDGILGWAEEVHNRW